MTTKLFSFVFANAITTAVVVGYRSSADYIFSVRRSLPALKPVLSSPYDDLSVRPPRAGGPLPVTYTNDPAAVRKWLRKNCRSGVALGFDVESVPNAPWYANKSKGPATVQLATTDDCLVVHLAPRHFYGVGGGGDRCPPAVALDEVLSDPSVLKIGTGVDSDMLDLFRYDRELRARGRVDLGVGLKRAVEDGLGLELPKKKKLSMSDWSRTPLANDQLDYCARDAWAGAAVFEARGGDVESVRSVLRRTELPIWEMCRRESIRKRAKSTRKRLMYDHYGTKCPKPVRRKLEILDRIIKDTRMETFNLFEQELLGLTIS